MLQNGGLNGEIFIVDDDAIVRESMSIMFSQAGYQVMTFSEGTSCVATARVRVPTCILMDMCMPGLSGLDILKQLDAANYPAPILIVSSYGDIPIAVEAIRNGAYDFIEKQMDPNLIVKRVLETIERLGTPATEVRNVRNPMATLSGPRPPHPPGNRGAGADCGGRDQQGSRENSWNKPTNSRMSSLAYYEKAWRQECG